MSIELNIFEQALRKRLLFPTNIGGISIEDLWQLPLTSTNNLSLDEIAMALQRQINKDGGVTSFVNPEKKGDGDLALRLLLVTRVIEVKLAERDEKAAAVEKRQKRAKLLEVYSRRKDKEFDDMPLDQLEKLIDEAA